MTMTPSQARRRRLCNTLKVLNLLAAGKSTAFAAIAAAQTESRVQEIVDKYGPERADYTRNARKLMTAVLEQETHELIPESPGSRGRAA